MRLSPLPIGGGSILLEGEDVLAAGKARLRELRGSRMSMIFQEPMPALNPVHRVGEQVIELLRAEQGKGNWVSPEERGQKSVVKGQSVSVRVEPGGRRIHKNKHT